MTSQLRSRGGDISPPDADGIAVGAAERTRESISPICVSIGHNVNLESAIELTLLCCKGYRMPEFTRLAHLVSLRVESLPRSHGNP